MAALAPTITQIVPVDQVATSGTPVADLAQPGGEVDPGPFTYDITLDPGSAYSVTGAQLVAAKDLDGAFSVSVTATGSTGVSPETTQTLTFADNENPYDDSLDHYPGNPQFPPPLATDATTAPWDLFIRRATVMIVPGARDGVDFNVARPSRTEPNVNTYWDDAVLGPRPSAEIDALAKQLAAEWPLSGATE